ncbi:hypothetical protein [Acidithiobacillus sp. AMEEHan]|uniref:hypothetical protein n=1 Tax=Acidithiobacillus sp. AMEEHan TaxID=2994951 RepID=UPI0027E476FA|nr:hypothetical protein [Acidithiobacillus sp. AMEEHan]
MKPFLVSTFACAALLCSSSIAFAANASDAQKAISAAQAAMAKAESIHYQWLDTPKFLKEAEAAEKAGKYDEAVAKAQHAEELAKLSYAQGEAQAKKYNVTLGEKGITLN